MVVAHLFLTSGSRPCGTCGAGAASACLMAWPWVLDSYAALNSSTGTKEYVEGSPDQYCCNRRTNGQGIEGIGAHSDH